MVNIITFGLYALALAVFSSPIAAIVVGALAIAPMVLYLKTKPRSSGLLKVSVVILSFLWLLAIIVSHEIDRTPLFWGGWIYGGLAIIPTGMIAFFGKQSSREATQRGEDWPAKN